MSIPRQEAGHARARKRRPAAPLRVVSVLEAGVVAVVDVAEGQPGPESRVNAAHAAPAPRGSATLAVLPRSLYLTRITELPQATEAETRQMLQLEVESEFPPEFGEVDVSYRPLSATASGAQRCEVYIVRRARLRQYLDTLTQCGIEPDAIVPSAVPWLMLHERGGWEHLATGRWHEQQMEAAAVDEEGAVQARGFSGDAAAIHRQLSEYLRHHLPVESTGSMAVDWIGADAPAASNGRYHWRSMTANDSAASLLQASAAALAAGGDDALISTVNLLPPEMLAQRRRRRARRSLLGAGAVALVGVLLLAATLLIAGMRLEAERAAMEARLASVRTEGQRVGGRLEQLSIVQQARAGREDFTRIMEGLLDATPSGVSYNQVDLDRDRRIQLRGQAESLALPFLLPQKLEASPAFKEVLLKDAGQSNQGQGAVVEFRLEARLESGGRR